MSLRSVVVLHTRYIFVHCVHALLCLTYMKNTYSGMNKSSIKKGQLKEFENVLFTEYIGYNDSYLLHNNIKILRIWYFEIQEFGNISITDPNVFHCTGTNNSVGILGIEKTQICKMNFSWRIYKLQKLKTPLTLKMKQSTILWRHLTWWWNYLCIRRSIHNHPSPLTYNLDGKCTDEIQRYSNG